MEMVGKTKRVVVGILAHAFYSIAFFTGALIAYLVTSWRWLQVAYTLPVVIFIPYYWIISESARWLSAKGRSAEAKTVLIKVARANHKQSLRTKTMVNSGVYYGLSLNTSDLGGNDYINFMISGAVEIPGLLFACFIIEKSKASETRKVKWNERFLNISSQMKTKQFHKFS
ncbi:Organic cation transporter protein [Armadillidium nasatum]|uniref:Organic cation transporter protein n=1 Tax=Armadillidium nasatum TaxID=96803 RepID=A0A5N5T6K1_9CRUS|nr:Organic cation transporter protein [Armadillidium nasatum]